MQVALNCPQRPHSPTVLAAVRKALRMTKRLRSSFGAALRVWAAFIGGVFKRSARIQGVFLHDPAAGKPKNLDDPFHDARAQERVGDFIARATRTPERKPPK
jgi:hypothetical protein